MAQPASGSGFDPSQWTAEAADRIVATVDTVKSKTTVPVVSIARALAYGLIFAVVGVAAVVVLLVGGLRLLDVYVGNAPGLRKPGRSVYVVYLVVGMLCSLIGFWLMSKGRKRPTSS